MPFVSSLQKAWLFIDDYVASVASILDATAHTLWFIKAAHCSQLAMVDQLGNPVAVGAAPGKWSVKGSSDGVTAGMDNADRTLIGGGYDGTKWIRAAAGVAHSWVVFQDPSGLWSICLDFVGAQDYSADIVISKSPFVGGTTLNRPVAANETSFLIATGANKQIVQNAAPGAAKLHARLDENGRSFILRSVNGTGRAELGLSFQMLDGVLAEDAHNGWLVADFNSGTPGPFDSGRLGSLSSSYILGRTANGGATPSQFGMTYPSTSSGGIFSFFAPTDATDGKFRRADMGLFTYNPYSWRGRMLDWKWTTTTETGYTQGSLHPQAPAPPGSPYDFIKIGHTVIPGRAALSF